MQLWLMNCIPNFDLWSTYSWSAYQTLTYDLHTHDLHTTIIHIEVFQTADAAQLHGDGILYWQIFGASRRSNRHIWREIRHDASIALVLWSQILSFLGRACQTSLRWFMRRIWRRLMRLLWWAPACRYCSAYIGCLCMCSICERDMKGADAVIVMGTSLQVPLSNVKHSIS